MTVKQIHRLFSVILSLSILFFSVDGHALSNKSTRIYETGNSYLADGGIQELEVDCYDAGVFASSHPDNFGFDQMIVGGPNESAAVFLVDYVDNGNRNGPVGPAEALYLFGKDGEDGLRLLNGSILYMGGLNVYVMLGGVMTDLTTLFGPDVEVISFDEGWLYLDRPDVKDFRNLLKNGGIEVGVNPPTNDCPVVTLPAGADDIYKWQIDSETINWIHESFAADSHFHDGKRYIEINNTETGNGVVSQNIRTEPNSLYHVWFDMAVDPFTDSDTKCLRLSSATGSLEEITATGAGWKTKTWCFTASEDTTTLRFESIHEPGTPFSVNIDNVIVLPADLNDVPPYNNFIVQINNVDITDCSSTQLTVTVTDANLMAVTGLDDSNFFVFEDDNLKTPVSVELNTAPISVCLVLDYSGSMSDEAIEAMEEAAVTFVSNMYDYDSGEIIKFSAQIQITQEFTDDKNTLIDAIEQSPGVPPASTRLYDTIYRAISDTAEQTGRKAVIALTDGDDTLSVKTLDDVVDYAVNNDVPVFTIGLDQEIDVNNLKIIAEQTGGAYYESPTSDDLIDIYEALSVILKNQYLVTYENSVCDPDNYNDTGHEVLVTVSLDESYGEDSESFTCPPACNSDTDSDDDIDGS